MILLQPEKRLERDRVGLQCSEKLFSKANASITILNVAGDHACCFYRISSFACSPSATQSDELPAIAFRWFALPRRFEMRHRFALFY